MGLPRNALDGCSGALDEADEDLPLFGPCSVLDRARPLDPGNPLGDVQLDGVSEPAEVWINEPTKEPILTTAQTA